MQTTDTGSSLRLRVVPTAQTTGRIAMDVTQQGSQIAVGDLNGDGRLDLRAGAAGGGGGGSGVSMSVAFDELTRGMVASVDAQGSSLTMSGDPDFDQMRFTNTPGVADIALTGDPDFDLVRISANEDTAKIRMSGQVSGDPDFDLLRITGTPTDGEMTMQMKNSIGNVRRGMTHSVDDEVVRTFLWKQTAGPVVSMIDLSSDSAKSVASISNDDGTKVLTLRADSGGGEIAIDEEGVQKIAMSTDGSSAGIAINEEGINISMNADSGGGGGIAVEEQGIQKMSLSTDGSSSEVAIGEEGVQVTMRADSGGSGSYAISEEGVQKIRLDTDSTHAGIAINEEGINISMNADSGGPGRIAINEEGIERISWDSDGDGYLFNSLKIGTTVGTNHIEVVGGANCDGTTWNNASDVNSKENFQQVNGEEILERLEDLEITRWNYKGKNETEHIGPTAQDFYKAFGVGGDDKSISTVD
ncbi:MAG: tail fiber domain-containing protein, partial [Candidatus Zixiibacteriota bacterium]